MAWRCTGATNAELIANLAKHGIIQSEVVASVSESMHLEKGIWSIL